MNMGELSAKICVSFGAVTMEYDVSARESMYRREDEKLQFRDGDQAEQAGFSAQNSSAEVKVSC